MVKVRPASVMRASPCTLDPVSGLQDGGSAQGVPDENARGLVMLSEVVGRLDEIVDIRGEIGVGKVAFALPQPREVEPQHGNVLPIQGATNAPHCPQIFRAGEAMGEEREGIRCALRGHVEASGQLVSLLIGEVDLLERHNCRNVIDKQTSNPAPASPFDPFREPRMAVPFSHAPRCHSSAQDLQSSERSDGDSVVLSFVPAPRRIGRAAPLGQLLPFTAEWLVTSSRRRKTGESRWVRRSRRCARQTSPPPHGRRGER